MVKNMVRKNDPKASPGGANSKLVIRYIIYAMTT